MTGYFDRLAQRAQGGAALTGLPVVRPLAAIYRGEAEQRGGLDTPLDSDAETLAPKPAVAIRSPPVGTPRSETAHADTRSIEGRIKGDESTGSRPISGDPTRTQTAVKDVATRVALRERSRGPVETMRRSPPAPSTQAPLPMIDAADPPGPQAGRVMTVEQIADAIEATPPANSSGEPAFWAENAVEWDNPPPAPPSVSIGRIDIVVAPPATPPVPPERTRGFENYARLRRGLAR
jgi:hypothetical protein